MGGLLIPTAALLSSLQWVSDGRSRVAEHMGEMRGLLIPTAALLSSLQWVSDGRSRYAEPLGRWEVCYVMYVLHCVMYVLHCVMSELRSVLEGHVYMKPTASCGAAQLWV